MPEAVVKATEDLHAQALLLGHAGKFATANHAWDDPYIRVSAASKEKSYSLLTPKIGEFVQATNTQQHFSQ